MSITYTCKFDRAEINAVIQAITEYRKNIGNDPNSSGHDYAKVLELEKKLAGMVDSGLDCFG
jgi:hypothetical protein